MKSMGILVFSLDNFLCLRGFASKEMKVDGISPCPEKGTDLIQLGQKI